jgi:hypothetical protein
MSFGKHKNFVAIAEDANGNVISNGIKYSWNVISNAAKGSEINKDRGDSMIFAAGKITGQVKIQVIAQHGVLSREDSAHIDIKDVSKTRKANKGEKNIPRLERVTSFEHPMWHSKLDENLQVLYCNTAHKDYIAIQDSANKRHRYIADLYAKELTLAECKNLNVVHYGERLLEILSSLDRHLDLYSK